VHHRSLTHLTIAHIDCDAFFASVERRDQLGLLLSAAACVAW
jgi:nucleotidyltransferase/DNA polymerase involved in DNA repair